MGTFFRCLQRYSGQRGSICERHGAAWVFAPGVAEGHQNCPNHSSTDLLKRSPPQVFRTFQPPSVGHATTGHQYVFTLFVAVSAGVTEEVIFRGILLPQFHLLTSNIAAAGAIQSCVFALAHGGNQSPTLFLKHFCSGCLFAYAAITRKSLWPAILAHVLFDVLVFTIQFRAR